MIAKRFSGLILLFLFYACLPTEENSASIISEDYFEEVFFIEYNSEGIDAMIETDAPATFRKSESKNSLEIDPFGRINTGVDPGTYWVEMYWDSKPDIIYSIPVLVTPFKENAKRTISSLKGMKHTSNDFILIIRHANASIGVDQIESEVPDWWKSCDSSLARQLNETGKQNSKKIGDALKNLSVPIGKCISSEFCRATQTFEFMQLDLPMALDPILNHENANPIDPIYPGVFDLIEREKDNSGLMVLVGHYNLISGMPDRRKILPFRMSDAFLMKHNSGNNPEFIGAVPVYFWDLFF